MKYKILIIFFFVAQLTQAQSILVLMDRTNDFFTNLNEGKFEEAHGFFDESIKVKISSANLKSFWTDINTDLGDLKSLGNIQSKIQNEYYLVTLICEFSKGKQGFQLLFNKNEKIVGLFLVPRSNEVAYKDPVYADTSLYKEQYITIKSPGHSLAGMLTTPRGATNFPVIVLVHGLGPADMDETVDANKPFRDLALGLAAQGIATIRYVKRTLIYPTEFSKAFTVKEEVIDDADSAITFARSVPGADKKQIYLFGHSLGGMLAPRLAALAPDLKGIILAAAPARKLSDIIIEQYNYSYKSLGDTTAAVKKQYDTAINEVEKTKLLKLGAYTPDSLLSGMPASYWIDMNVYNQIAAAKKLKNRILILQGGRDIQVSVLDYNLWKNALSNNRNVTFKLYPDINHLFVPQTEKDAEVQYQRAGNVADYLINDIAQWIKAK